MAGWFRNRFGSGRRRAGMYGNNIVSGGEQVYGYGMPSIAAQDGVGYQGVVDTAGNGLIYGGAGYIDPVFASNTEVVDGYGTYSRYGAIASGDIAITDVTSPDIGFLPGTLMPYGVSDSVRVIPIVGGYSNGVIGMIPGDELDGNRWIVFND